MRLVLAVMLLLVAFPVLGDEPALVPSPFPTIPAAINPDPVPISPDAVPLVTSGTIYIVQDEKPFTLLASPSGIVSIPEKPEEGPIKIRGIFADGNGKIETRTYKSKYITVVDVVDGMTGRVELFFIPDGVTNLTSNLIQRMLIDIGVAPRPPPVPPPTPPPKPQPDDSFRVAVNGVTAKFTLPDAQRKKVASAFRAVATEITDGKIGTLKDLTHRTADSIIDQVGLNDYLTTWVPWRDAVTVELSKQSLKAPQDHVKPWSTIADVLEGK